MGGLSRPEGGVDSEGGANSLNFTPFVNLTEFDRIDPESAERKTQTAGGRKVYAAKVQIFDAFCELDELEIEREGLAGRERGEEGGEREERGGESEERGERDERGEERGGASGGKGESAQELLRALTLKGLSRQALLASKDFVFELENCRDS